MPRTKRPVRRQKKSVDQDEVSMKLDKLATELKNKIDARVLIERRNIEIAFTILIGSITQPNLHKTVGQLKNELYLKEVSTRRTRQSTRSGSHDDGYLTENSTQGSGERAAVKLMAPSSSSGHSTFRPPSSSSRSTGRRSRSADPTSVRKPPTASRMTQRRLSRSMYRTPAYNKNASVNYPPITPKVTPQTPLTLLRQPRQGEMVVSMSGSPVIVSTCNTMQAEEKANCNILLQDGTMLSLQPKELRPSQAYIPFSLMDSNVLRQIKTLQENLATVVKMGEKAIV